MGDESTVLVDSDGFIAWLIKPDAHHQRVLSLLNHFDKHAIHMTTTSYVVAETATLLSRRYSQAQARNFVQFIHKTQLPVLEIMGDLRRQAERLFEEQTIEKVSLIDCANVIAIQHFAIPAILSFDRFYSRCHIPSVETLFSSAKAL